MDLELSNTGLQSARISLQGARNNDSSNITHGNSYLITNFSKPGTLLISLNTLSHFILQIPYAVNTIMHIYLGQKLNLRVVKDILLVI
jgi:hypothetical protein